MSSANMNIGYSIASTDGDGKDKKKNDQGARNGGREDDLFGSNADLSDRRESQFGEEDEEKFSEFYKSELPWDITFAYSLTYSNAQRESEIVNNSVMISANTSLTTKWKVGVSTGYDFVRKGVTFTQLRLERDLLSWRMDFNWVPFGDNTFWGFFVGIKAAVLSDLKYDKRSIPDRTLR